MQTGHVIAIVLLVLGTGMFAATIRIAVTGFPKFRELRLKIDALAADLDRGK